MLYFLLCSILSDRKFKLVKYRILENEIKKPKTCIVNILLSKIPKRLHLSSYANYFDLFCL